ncbi:hypothetical protein, conserved [Trypanosoma brucei gambiense DAL972]|uniref:Uncharacterized protein n=2 Tax=Trypanosoma brucei TaxID=5691 RepID=D0A2J9_TRYB9|nr:hypothetical protein, conserved [Trypanosoma brucei gambiense DAL972]RHW69785.1 hypothetical protein DPX39_100053100 [Trypanosoma brucei equiperdum]CBH15493.1 hypothetical protein, conserved [Trypanosoma brucei gambiense DAL972]|eukprot:XP_011777757.1 hypothetical protein, conserved [Trypanosoma brucei gambiense DAL972]
MAVRALRPIATRNAFHDEELARMNHVHDLRLEPLGSQVPCTSKNQPVSTLPRVRRHCMAFHSRINALGQRERDRVLGPTDWKRTLRRSSGECFYGFNSRKKAVRRRLKTATEVEIGDHFTAGRLSVLDVINAQHRGCGALYNNAVTTSTLPPLNEGESGHHSRCALKTLRNLLLPICRLWLRKRGKKKVTLAPSESREKLPSPRTREKVIAVGVVLSYLRRRCPLSSHSFRQLREAAVILQRAYKRHKTYVDAHVELNYRKIRASVEEMYLKDVEDENRRAEEEYNGLDINGSDEMSLEFPRCGERLPEIFIRYELRSLYYCWMWLCVEAGSNRRLPTFLSQQKLYSVLDNVCYITSEMRDDRLVRAHLERRPKMVVSYYGRYDPSNEWK